MADTKRWFCRWSHRRNKVFYVDIKTRDSRWTKPDDFVASEDEVQRELFSNYDAYRQHIFQISDWETKKKFASPDNLVESRGSKRTLDTVTSEEADTGYSSDDYLQVFSKKRQMLYYYNLKNNSSQWKRPACLQAAETLQAIENTKSKEEVSFTTNGKSSVKTTGESDNETEKSTLNAEAPCFELLSKLNVNAQPFIPSLQIIRAVSPTASPTTHRNGLKCGKQRSVVVQRTISEATEQSVAKYQPRIPAKERLSLNKSYRSEENHCVFDRSEESDTDFDRSEKSHSVFDRNEEYPNVFEKSEEQRRPVVDKSEERRTVFDRLGVRRPPEECLLQAAATNVAVLEPSRVPFFPPTPETELVRYSEVSQLRQVFNQLCNEDIGIDEPTEAFNRWLFDRQLSCTEKTDPILSCSEKRSVSLYREIMEDLPAKYKLPRSTPTCTSTLVKYVNLFKDIATHCDELDGTKIEKQCQETLDKNRHLSDTRELMRSLRSGCDAEITKYYHDRVEEVCEKMNNMCQESALRVAGLAKEEFGNISPLKPPPSPSTQLVGCRPAMPLISDDCMPRSEDVTVSTSGMHYKMTYKDSTIFLNVLHYKKLETLCENAALASTKDRNRFNSFVWCLFKRYKMLSSSMTAGKMALQDNFGLHAALPRKVFDLLHRNFHVTFECFASPFNCYFKQYCSAFSDTDCYFGSRGSFFELNPKSGSFQANPPFSEEVMQAMANHMILLLDESIGPLMFVIFIPDWTEPVTPAIPALKNTVYLSHNILLSSGAHQYVAGNQHIQSLSHYNAVHGTQVFVLQNEKACAEWPVTKHDMDLLREAMSTNY